MVHIMVDIETLGTDPDSMILTIGAVPFSEKGEVLVEKDFYFYERVDLKCYDFYKNSNYFTMNFDTLLWWMKQDEDPRGEAFLNEPRYPIDKVISKFVEWIKQTCDYLRDRKIHMWSHGKEFDILYFKMLSIN